MSTPSAHLDEGRRAYQREEWRAAFDALSAADGERPLGADDLELLARSAYMLGRDDDCIALFERAQQLLRDAGDHDRAARDIFWIWHSLSFRGEHARAAGWMARAQRLIDGKPEGAAHGWVQVPLWIQALMKGDFERGRQVTVEVAALAERHGDLDLLWLARDDQARALMYLGRDEEALRLLDEALVVAMAGELSPIVTGIVYCNTISFCHSHFALRRLREWTRALTTWCDRQPEMLAHAGVCRVHRAELLVIEGEWDRALELAREYVERYAVGVVNQQSRGRAHYCLGDAHRLRGELDAAEEAYKKAAEAGRDPQPGLALLRLAQARPDAAEAAIRRVVTEQTGRLARPRLLPASVEIMLALGRVDDARAMADELTEVATTLGREVPQAMAAHARGAVALAAGQAQEALPQLRQAWTMWDELGARHEIARIRTRVGLACRALGDEDSAAIEIDGAAAAFDAMGAPTDRAWLDGLSSAQAPVAPATDLTARELEVLRLVAQGDTNAQIGAKLFISDLTVKRHVANILTKLDLPSRSAAAAHAARLGLV